MERHPYSNVRLGLSGILALLATGGLHAQTILFVPQNQVAVGDKPDALVYADIENNGKPDLLAANQGAATLSVLRSIGNGFFTAIPSVTTGQSPQFIAVADFNGDGKLDLAVANFGSNNVSVLLGNGNGTFRLLNNLSATSPSAIAVADFFGDGNLDLAVVETNSNSVAILRGNGTGNFTPFSTLSVGTHPVALAVSDFNGDGKPDLAVVNSGSNNVSILLGNGDGTFQAARNFAAGQAPAYVALGDFNSDGNTDLAFVNPNGATSSITVLLGLGNGTFQSFRTFAAGSNSSFIVAGDFNLDGKTDLAVTNNGSDTISVFQGVDDGTFLTPINFTVGSAPNWITIADVNGDGKPDLLVANGSSNNVSVLINHTATVSQPVITSVVNAASLQSGPVSPGELVTILGSGLGPGSPVGLQLTASGTVATTLGQTQVLFDGVPAPLIYASGGQVNAAVPYAVSGQSSTQVVVTNNGQTSAALTLAVTASTPALFTADSSGAGQGAILNQDGSLNSVMNPAAPGSEIVLYATGTGQTNPPGIDGMVATSVLPAPVLPISVTIGGQAAQVLYAGAAPDIVAGVTQINVVVPAGLSPGAVPVVVQAGPAVSPSGVTMAVQ